MAVTVTRAPRTDRATKPAGRASGKRQHKPIKFTIELGTASPQLERAHATSVFTGNSIFHFGKI